MKTHLLRTARRCFNSEYVSRQTNRHNQRQWVRSLRFLGCDWLLVKQQERTNAPQ